MDRKCRGKDGQGRKKNIRRKTEVGEGHGRPLYCLEIMKIPQGKERCRRNERVKETLG